MSGRVVLRDRDGNLVDVSSDGAGADLDERARQHMDWLRAGAQPSPAVRATDGRHGAYDPAATAVIPAIRRG